MLAGADHGISKANIVIGAAKDLDLLLKIKREKTALGPGRGFHVFGVIETIYFEPDDGCKMDLSDAKGVGRRLYWPEGGPTIARAIPDGNLLIVSRLPIRRGYAAMPDIPDHARPEKNPYRVDRHGQSHLMPGQKEFQAPKCTQDLAKIASAKFKNFLVFHPIAQIILITVGGGARWGTIGNHKTPLSSLTSFDDSKLALLIDPYTGEMFFKGGRYDIADHLDSNAVRAESTEQRNEREEVQTLLQGRA
jgi:hypothetical protein